MTTAEWRLLAATWLVAAVLAAPVRDTSAHATVVALENLARGRLQLRPGPDAEAVGDRAVVPGRISSASAALGDGVAAAGPPGRIYFGAAPGLNFLLLPVFVVARAVAASQVLLVLILFGAGLPHALGTVAIRRAVLGATGCSESAAHLAACAHGLGTIALPFATRLMAHSAVIGLLALGLAALLGGPRPRAALAGALGAAALACHYSTGLAFLGLGALALVRGGLRGALAFSLGAAPIALALAAYHTACFGSPFATGYDFRVQPDVQVIVAEGRYGFGLPHPSVLAELLLGVRRGVLFTEPVLFVGALGLGALARRDKAAAVALATILLLLASNAGRARDWAGGLSFGSRYLSPALPFLALGYPRGFELARSLGRAALAASVALAVAAAATNWGFSALTTLETFFALGPRALAPTTVLLGGGVFGSAPAILSAAALSVVLPLAAALVAWPLERRGRFALAGLAIAPWLAIVPFELTLARGGPGAASELATRLRRREMLLELDVAWHPMQARRMAWSAAQVKDPVVYEAALRRVVALDPGDAAARAEVERLQR